MYFTLNDEIKVKKWVISLNNNDHQIIVIILSSRKRAFNKHYWQQKVNIQYTEYFVYFAVVVIIHAEDYLLFLIFQTDNYL